MPLDLTHVTSTSEPVRSRESSGSVQRIALVTAGQTPRGDVVRYITDLLPLSVSISEFGALDGLSREEIRRLAPAPGELSIATVLATGERVVIARRAIEERMQALVSRMAPAEFALVALLSTGFVRDFPGKCPVINMQRAVDTAVDALVTSGRRVGLIQPIQRQIVENELGLSSFDHVRTWLDPSYPIDCERVARECAGCEVLVLNSIAFDEPTARRLGELTSKPVILPRRVIAGAARMLLDVAGTVAGPHSVTIVDPALETRLMSLTPREREVMWQMVEGLSTKAIARRLGVSPRTIGIHRTKVLSKTGVTSTSALIHLALSHFNKLGNPSENPTH
ncbi:AroM family protein [Microvirga splendida]|uniref:AroM family protein n=1 Tax=Microvirga splendida TaxID=2795727 RepID=A0ABS0Y4G2_9HYPH|nr:AroM family protein [Microvirga splendida]MBJ6127178.1 AroM family protein [Microvirga splendida]